MLSRNSHLGRLRQGADAGRRRCADRFTIRRRPVLSCSVRCLHPCAGDGQRHRGSQEDNLNLAYWPNVQHVGRAPGGTLTTAVVSRCGLEAGVPGEILDCREVGAGIEQGVDERSAQVVRAERCDAGSLGDGAQPQEHGRGLHGTTRSGEHVRTWRPTPVRRSSPCRPWRRGAGGDPGDHLGDPATHWEQRLNRSWRTRDAGVRPCP